MHWQFEKGKDVVCVLSEWNHKLLGSKLTAMPQLGWVYRVCDIKMASEIPGVLEIVGWRVEDHLMLRLTETGDWASAIGFRPVRDTNIAVLKKLLVPNSLTEKSH